PHLIGEMFKQRLNLDVVHVPYKGGGPSVAATVAGETQFSFENPASSLPLVEAGRMRALASTSDRRSSQMPDVPTMIEAGIADFTSVSFTGVVAPAGTPGTIVDRLNAAINVSLKSREIEKTLVKSVAGDRKHLGQARRQRQDLLAGGVRGFPRRRARQVGGSHKSGRRAGAVTA